MSVEENLFSMHETLGSISSTKNKLKPSKWIATTKISFYNFHNNMKIIISSNKILMFDNK